MLDAQLLMSEQLDSGNGDSCAIVCAGMGC